MTNISVALVDKYGFSFGGSDGKTVFVTQSDGGYIEAFLTDPAWAGILSTKARRLLLKTLVCIAPQSSLPYVY
jgi:hypothetical protein